MATVRRTEVTEPVGTEAVRHDEAVERRWALDGSDIVALLAGLLFLVMGLIALVELGFSDFPSEATTDVFGLAHTQIVGIVSIVLGLFFLAGVGGYGRSTTTFAGALALVVGIVVVAAGNDLDATIATEDAYGWLAIVVGIIVLVAAIAIPTTAARTRRVVDHRM